MDARLEAQAEEITQHATEHGWIAIAEPIDAPDGCDDAVGIGGSWYAIDPDTEERTEFLFTIAFGVKSETGRVNVFQQTSYANAPFVVTVEDGTGRYWHGPARSWRRALADPLDWTGWEPGD